MQSMVGPDAVIVVNARRVPSADPILSVYKCANNPLESAVDHSILSSESICSRFLDIAASQKRNGNERGTIPTAKQKGK
jgi:hypothetical protein